MKYRYRLFFLLAFLTIGLVVNSCKKDKQNNIQALLTNGQWQLASLQVTHFLGAEQQGLTDTLGSYCLLTEVFKFNADKTCSYTNFDCVAQGSTGHWDLSSDQLVLYSDFVAKESTFTRDSTITTSIPVTAVNDSLVSLKPFSIAKIVNLGQYSLVLQTGDLETFYQPTQKRTVILYGFVRQKTQ